MIEAPRQNWTWYEERSELEHVAWLRSLTPAAAVRLCEDLHSFARRFMPTPPDDDAFERQRWGEKLAIRRKIVAALVSLDRRRE